LCPQAEAAYKQIIFLPMFPGMRDDEVGTVVKNVEELIVDKRK
jgi:dTDP-4-amino-4,6-dideoxygalactose transaminase